MKKLLYLLCFLLPFTSNGQYYISTVVGNGSSGATGDGGQATNASLVNPMGLAYDAAGNLYISEYWGHKIRKVSPDGTISTFAGTGEAGYTGNGGQATAAKMFHPIDVTVGADGAVYVAELTNYCIRRIGTDGIISLVAGTGEFCGTSPDGLSATSTCLDYPYAIHINAAGEMFIPELQNNRVRKVNTSGIVSTIAGTGISGDDGDGGPASAARINNPSDCYVDAVGNIYIPQFNTDRIRMVDAAGIIHTIAGTGIDTYTGDGGLATNATLNNPARVITDVAGNIYVADGLNCCIRKITGGIITTIAGGIGYDYFGDGGPATAAAMKYTSDMVITPSGDILVSDANNHVVRKLSTIPPASVAEYKSPSVLLFPNPAKNAVSVSTPLAGSFRITIFNASGRNVYTQKMQSSTQIIDISFLPSGYYSLLASFIDHDYIISLVKE